MSGTCARWRVPMCILYQFLQCFVGLVRSLHCIGAGSHAHSVSIFTMFCWLGAQFALYWCRLPCGFRMRFYNVLLARCTVCAVPTQAPMCIPYQFLQRFGGVSHAQHRTRGRCICHLEQLVTKTLGPKWLRKLGESCPYIC